ncbi:MAG TPA: NUDIX domain-containing protein [Noviherbaspirillum sp.]|nr:NUDIX domain-containing protein [Noviherbaspirillum sp.]
MYKNPLPVSVGIIPSLTPGHIILVERSDGGTALPGGYVDELEDAIAAVNREVYEETGLELDGAKWKLFHSSITPDNKLLLFSWYTQAVAVPDSFMPNAEVVRLFSAPWNTSLKFPLHAAAVERWKNDAEPGWRFISSDSFRCDETPRSEVFMDRWAALAAPVNR